MSARMKLFTSLVNISEARTGSTIKLLEQSAHDVSSFKKAALLQTFSDLDYNRTVFTLAGDRDGLISCIVEMCNTALRNIDLGSHKVFFDCYQIAHLRKTPY
uniref:Formiminotransferase N-terminal subdomain domain-containing protein n=1 Tax=Rhodosorus marinus TaxID=101924 RepID=A0A7S0BS93_9RHOD|mmetsp:Transcript_5267/g.7319  ORF Transcript_5267/g.7319 Transcript_5267/m.7319 type:complete len:102 (+) Transcript_5267:63-368(+)